MQPYQTEFTLSRKYLAECFDESLPHGKHAKPNFLFPIVLLIAGTVILKMTEYPDVFGVLFIALGVIELLHIRFRRSWWLARQMWGKTGGAKVTMIIDDECIQTISEHHKTSLKWDEVADMIETEFGVILVTFSDEQQYVSKSLLTDEAFALIRSKYKFNH